MLSYAVKTRLARRVEDSPISAVDLFCGAGGLTHGLLQAGIRVNAGIDIDKHAAHAYVANNPGAEFLNWDLTSQASASIAELFDPGRIRLLAGCAPCQPFSKLTNGRGRHKAWDLLDYFGRFIDDIRPELVTMENVPELAERGKPVLDRFLAVLERNDYEFDSAIVRCEQYRIPQIRRRFVLLASRLGTIGIPEGTARYPNQWKTVEQAIGHLPPVASGESCPDDRLHTAAQLSEMNMRRIKATPHDGGTQRDWPEELLLDCHRKQSGKSFYQIYGRMWWNRPSPTMTTLCTGLGNGRFGHPAQDRAITHREAALLQSFPEGYDFWPGGEKLNKSAVSRLIGNSVPPKLARALGSALLEHVQRCGPENTPRHPEASIWRKPGKRAAAAR